MPTWVDELRIVRGRAIWTAAFIPPAEPYRVGDVVEITGSVAWAGVATGTFAEAADAASANGAVFAAPGAFAAIEREDVVRLRGWANATGTLAATEQPDTISVVAWPTRPDRWSVAYITARRKAPPEIAGKRTSSVAVFA